jgi:hypothetical protein
MLAVMFPACGRLRWAGLALGGAIAVQGCAGPVPAAEGSFAGAAPRAAAEVPPPGAIPIGDQLYQVPIGADDDGCPRYRLYSPTRLVAQAIYYRDSAGGFTPDRHQAACVGGAPD